MIQNIKMAAILLYKTMKRWKKPINNPLLTLAMLVYQKKKILRRFRPMLGNPGYFCFESGILGQVVRTRVSANLGLNFNPGFFFFLSKALSLDNFLYFFSISNHQIVGKGNSAELAF